MSKIYKAMEHDEFGNCLEGITGHHDRYFTASSPGVFITDTDQTYVLVEPQNPDAVNYIHPELGPVELWNTHNSGELRWKEPAHDTKFINADCLAAIKHFGLRPERITEDEWQKILEGYLIKREDLSEVEIKVLEKGRDCMRSNRSARFISKERIKDLKGEWHDTIRNSPLTSAMYVLARQSLVSIGGGMSGTGFGEESHIWRSSEYFSITTRGLKVLNGESA